MTEWIYSRGSRPLGLVDQDVYEFKWGDRVWSCRAQGFNWDLWAHYRPYVEPEKNTFRRYLGTASEFIMTFKPYFWMIVIPLIFMIIVLMAYEGFLAGMSLLMLVILEGGLIEWIND